MIEGIFHPYSADQIKNFYLQSNATNKTWTDHGKQYVKRKTVEASINEAFWKSCFEGEVTIDGLLGTTIFDVGGQSPPITPFSSFLAKPLFREAEKKFLFGPIETEFLFKSGD